MTPDDPTQFYARTRSAKRIVVVDLGFLGDSVHLAPALWEIDRHYPEAQLHTLSAPLGAEVLKMVPCVDRAWAYPLGDPSPPWWRHWDVIRALRRERFDLALNFSGADRTLFVTRLTGARWRASRLGGRDHWWKKLFIPVWTPRSLPEAPVWEQRLAVLRDLGMAPSGAPRFDLAIPPEARAWAASEFPGRVAHLSVNASTPMKEWPLENWAEFARLLLARYPGLTLAATAGAKPREQERIEGLARAVNDPRLRLVRPAPPLTHLTALLSRCVLHAGADSGVLHLALAAGTPTLALFRDYAGKNEWLPRGPRHRHLTRPCACAEQGRILPECQGRAACLGRIAPAEAVALASELL